MTPLITRNGNNAFIDSNHFFHSKNLQNLCFQEKNYEYIFRFSSFFVQIDAVGWRFQSKWQNTLQSSHFLSIMVRDEHVHGHFFAIESIDPLILWPLRQQSLEIESMNLLIAQWIFMMKFNESINSIVLSHFFSLLVSPPLSFSLLLSLLYFCVLLVCYEHYFSQIITLQ